MIDASTEITKLKTKRFQIKTGKMTEVIESPDTEEWMNILLLTKE